MKNILRLSFLAAMGLIIFASCTKRTTNNVVVAGTTSSMSGTFGGTKWVAATVTDTLSSGTLIATGVSATNSSVTITVPENITAATYQQSSGIWQIEYYYDATHYYFLTTGTVIISSNANGVLSGSFSGTFTNPATAATLSATTASFTVKYN